MAWRLGRVTALGSARLTLETSSGAVRLVLRPLASTEDVPLEEVWVTPGGRVELFIAPRLERSMLFAR